MQQQGSGGRSLSLVTAAVIAGAASLLAARQLQTLPVETGKQSEKRLDTRDVDAFIHAQQNVITMVDDGIRDASVLEAVKALNVAGNKLLLSLDQWTVPGTPFDDALASMRLALGDCTDESIHLALSEQIETTEKFSKAWAQLIAHRQVSSGNPRLWWDADHSCLAARTPDGKLVPIDSPVPSKQKETIVIGQE